MRVVTSLKLALLHEVKITLLDLWKNISSLTFHARHLCRACLCVEMKLAFLSHTLQSAHDHCLYKTTNTTGSVLVSGGHGLFLFVLKPTEISNQGSIRDILRPYRTTNFGHIWDRILTVFLKHFEMIRWLRSYWGRNQTCLEVSVEFLCTQFEGYLGSIW